LTPSSYSVLLWMRQAWSVHVTSATIQNYWRILVLVGMGKPVNCSDSATEALTEAMSALEQAAHAQHSMPDDEAFVSTNESINLTGEIEIVHERRSDKHIVQLLSQGENDQPVSDSESEYEVFTLSAHQALFMAAEVERFVLSHPETFTAVKVEWVNV
jgi:hypothetical protein